MSQIAGQKLLGQKMQARHSCDRGHDSGNVALTFAEMLPVIWHLGYFPLVPKCYICQISKHKSISFETMLLLRTVHIKRGSKSG